MIKCAKYYFSCSEPLERRRNDKKMANFVIFRQFLLYYGQKNEKMSPFSIDIENILLKNVIFI